jgi:hypothetical protein
LEGKPTVKTDWKSIKKWRHNWVEFSHHYHKPSLPSHIISSAQIWLIETST